MSLPNFLCLVIISQDGNSFALKKQLFLFFMNHIFHIFHVAWYLTNMGGKHWIALTNFKTTYTPSFFYIILFDHIFAPISENIFSQLWSEGRLADSQKSMGCLCMHCGVNDLLNVCFIHSRSMSNMSWLQMQQHKLQERQTARHRADRGPYEAKMLSELRTRMMQVSSYLLISLFFFL